MKYTLFAEIGLAKAEKGNVVTPAFRQGQLKSDKFIFEITLAGLELPLPSGRGTQHCDNWL
jgi:hypothetical protein